MAGLGCFAIASQMAFVREFLVVFAGNELCLGIIFACWFGGIVIGALPGGWLAQRKGNRPGWLLVCCTFLIGAAPLLLAWLRVFRRVLAVEAGEMPGLSDLLFSGLAIITPFGLLIGLSFPLACRLAANTEDTDVVGRTYVFESAGAILGGLAIGVVLAGRVGTFTSIVVTAMPLVTGLAWMCLGRRQVLRYLLAGAGFTCLGIVFLAGIFAGTTRWLDETTSSERFDSLETGTQRVGWADTPYQYLDLGSAGEQFTLYANGKVTATFPDLYRSRPRAHLVMTEHPAPRKVLLLGTASLEFLPVALQHPVERLDVVELDPGVFEVVQPYLSHDVRESLGSSRVHLHLTDGRRYLRGTRQQWDLIFSDAPDPDTAAQNRFYTREFFELARSRLANGGVFATRLSSSVTYLGTENASLIRTIARTLDSVFSRVLILPGGETFFLATDQEGVLLSDPEKLGDRYQQRSLADTRFSRHHFKALFQSGQVEDLRQQIAVRGSPSVNTDSQPVSYLQRILLWSHMLEKDSAGSLAWLATWPAWTWILLLLLFFVITSGALLGKRGSGADLIVRGSGLAVFTVGAVGLALELALTFAYQSKFGSLYRELGIIVAAFMAGLVTGGWFMNRWLKKETSSPLQLALVLFLLAGFTGLIPHLLSGSLLQTIPMWAGQGLILLLVILAGVGTGLVFPLSSHLTVSSGRKVGMAAGTLDAFDHLGAAAGALLTGVVLIPALGTTTTCMLLALATAFAGVTNLLVQSRLPKAQPFF
jgi:predicted membrane-bound spermidine synthase